MNTDVMFSSKKMDWETPQDFFNELDAEFHFDIDVACDIHNCKCAIGISEEVDALSIPWNITISDNKEIKIENSTCWMNPPYGRGIGKWIKKAHEEAQEGNTIVALVPARTDTKWFHDYIYNQYEIRFVKGRLKFGNSKHAAPFPSMVVIFKK